MVPLLLVLVPPLWSLISRPLFAAVDRAARLNDPPLSVLSALLYAPLQLGAADYIALCNAFHTIAISGIPVFSNETKSSGYRFVTFMDVAYEHRCRCDLLVCPGLGSFGCFQ